MNIPLCIHVTRSDDNMFNLEFPIYDDKLMESFITTKKYNTFDQAFQSIETVAKKHKVDLSYYSVVVNI